MSEADYCRILGVDSRVTLDVLKRAYRTKAKQLHPDINKSPDAHEEFVQLGEAYEYFVNKLTGKTLHKHKQHYNWEKAKRYRAWSEWERAQRAYARQRAAEHARMKYEAFQKSGYYKALVMMNLVLYVLKLFAVIMIFIGLPAIFVIWKGWPGVLLSFALVFMTVHIWAPFFRRFGLKKGQRDRF